MLALDMNKMLSSECLNRNDLHTFCKCNEILDNPNSREIPVEETTLDSTLECLQNIYSTAEVAVQNIGNTELNFFEDEDNGASTTLLPLSLFSYDPISVVPTEGSYSSDLERVFSPNPKHSDSQLELLNNTSTAKDENSELLHMIFGGSEETCGSSTEFQIWDVLDFYFSESISTFHFDSLMGFTNDIGTPYHQAINTISTSGRPLILPCLDKADESCSVHDQVLVEQTMNRSDDRSLYFQSQPLNSDIECVSGSNDVETVGSLDHQLLSRDLPDLMEIESPTSPIGLPKSQEERKAITLVLDLDETLVHSMLDHCENADFTLSVFFNMKQHTVYVKRRPHLQMFLEKVAQMFQVIIFTASQKIYAEQLIDKLDPDGKLISQRIYRDSCTFSEGTYSKDLTILGVDLAKVAIVDNTPEVFRLQMDNGIPIKSWFDDPSDDELVQLLPFLDTLVDAEDVRPFIAKKFSKKDLQN